MLRSVTATVVDDHRNPLTALGSEDFSAMVNGQRAEVKRAVVDGAPKRVVIALDASGRMGTFPGEWAIARTAVKDLVSNAPTDTDICLIAFNEDVGIACPFGGDHQRVLGWLQRTGAGGDQPLKASGGSALYDGIRTGLTQFGNPRFGDLIYAITDAWDNASRNRLEDVQHDLVERGVRLFVFSLYGESGEVLRAEPDSVQTLTVRRLLRRQVEDLKEVVAHTGGLWMDLTDFSGPPSPGYRLEKEQAERLVSSLQERYRVMWEPYRLELKLPEALNKPADLKIRIRATNRGHWQVRHPHRLMPCATGSAPEEKLSP